MGDALVREVARTPPTVAIDAAPYVCYLLNREWAAHLMGAVSVLLNVGEWEGATDERFSAIQTILEWLGGEECSMFKLRQSPTNPCHMEQSLDGGETWLFAFDYGACLAAGDVTNITNIWNEGTVFNTTQMVTYDGDITNIYNNWGYGDAQDVDRDTALCWAAKKFVDFVCETMIQIINDGEEESDNFADFYSSVSSGMGTMALWLAALAVFPVAGLYAGISLLGAAILIEVISTLWTTDTTPYEDETAKDLVSCHMYNKLVGQTPTYALWSSSADGTQSDPNAEKIRAAAYELMQDETLFVDFMGLMVDVIDAATLGDVEDDCEDCGWYHKHDFALGTHGFTVVAGGVWTDEEGYVVEKIPFGGGFVNQAKIRKTWASTNITMIRMVVDAAYGLFNEGPAAAILLWEDQTSGEYYQLIAPPSPTGGEDLTYSVAPVDNSTSVDVLLRVSNTGIEGDLNGSGVIKAIEYWGTGENPFD